MNKEIRGIKRLLKVGVVLGSFTLSACGGDGQTPLTSNAQHFTDVSLQAISSTALQTSTLSHQISATFRQNQDACAGNITTSATGDPHYHAQGTLSNGQSFNTSTWLDTSLGYANWLTSPIDNGYNIALTQSDISNLFLVTGLAVTTRGNNIRTQLSSDSSSTQAPIINIFDNGKMVTIPSLSANFQLTLSGGEQISWTLNPSPINAPGSVTTSPNLGALTETVSDGNTSSIATTINYWYGSGIGGFDVLVDASNVDLGGYMISTALGNGTVPCLTAGSTPAPTPTPSPSPTDTPCVFPTASSPNPHPTQNPNAGACTS